MKPRKIKAGEYEYRGKTIKREYTFDAYSGTGHTAWTVYGRYGRQDFGTLTEACRVLDMLSK